MKIAIFHNLPSGGAKRSLYEWTRRLAGRHELALYSLTYSNEAYLDLSPFVNNTRMYPCLLPFHNRPMNMAGMVGRYADLTALRSLSLRIAAEIDASRPDVVLVNHCWYTQAPYVLRYLRTPALYYCHEPPRRLVEPLPPRWAPVPPRRSGWLRRAGRALYRLAWKQPLIEIDRTNTTCARRILANSRYSREVLYRHYGRFAYFSRLGVDCQQFRPLALPKEHAVLSVGGLNPLKGHDFVIEAVAHIPTARRPAVYILADRGSPAERRFLEALAARLAVRLQIHERLSEDEVVALYNRVRVTACAQVMEPFGLVPLESMACETPVVAVAEAGLRETVLAGQTGVLTERDPEAFAGALAGLLDDRGRCERWGQSGRMYVSDEWTWERSAEQLEGHLAQAAGGRS